MFYQKEPFGSETPSDNHINYQTDEYETEKS
jgi:hypothetical protein